MQVNEGKNKTCRSIFGLGECSPPFGRTAVLREVASRGRTGGWLSLAPTTINQPRVGDEDNDDGDTTGWSRGQGCDRHCSSLLSGLRDAGASTIEGIRGQR